MYNLPIKRFEMCVFGRCFRLCIVVKNKTHARYELVATKKAFFKAFFVAY